MLNMLNKLKRIGYVLIIGLLLPACSEKKKTETGKSMVKRPNILIAVADDATFHHMSAYGNDWIDTPNFDRVATAGLLFNRAYTPNAKCAPSRACILTGRNPWQLEEAANHFPDYPAKFVTFMEALKEQGYFTGHTSKGWAPGNPGKTKDGKPRELTGKAYNEKTLEPPTKGISKNDYAANFEAFLEERPDGTPFCFWYGSQEPHRIYEYGSGIRLGNKKTEEIDEVYNFWPDVDTVRTDMLDYAYELEYFDKHLGQMLDHLEKKGELENTLILVVSDNGMPFPRIKGQAYELSHHLPMALMWKEGIKDPGRDIDDFANFIDFAPTLLEVAQLPFEESGMQPITGHSLVPYFEASDAKIKPLQDHILIGKERHDIGRPNDAGYPIRGMVTDSLIYIRNFKTERWPAGNPETGYLNVDGGATKSKILELARKGKGLKFYNWNFGKRPEEELYNIKNDPACIYNLAMRPKYQDVKDKLYAQMMEELVAQEDPRALGNGDIFDDYIFSDPTWRNFYERFMKGEVTPQDVPWVEPSDFEKIKEVTND